MLFYAVLLFLFWPLAVHDWFMDKFGPPGGTS